MRKTVAGVRPSSDYIKRNDTTLKGYGKSDLYNMALVCVAVQTAYVL